LSICTFCSFVPEDAWILNDYVVAIPHPEPLGSCHVAVAPRRHVAAFYDLDVAEQRHVWEVLRELRERISASLCVEGFDIGFAEGSHDDELAHTYVHVIPRIPGEELELPSGVQWVDLDA
jgi:diadenosine tetraphosphate (Ap4A) HIT family hydrolase